MPSNNPFTDLIRTLLRQKKTADQQPFMLRPRIEKPTEVESDASRLKEEEREILQSQANRPRVITPVTEQQKLNEETEWLRGAENRGRGGSIIERPSRLRSGLLQALSGIGEGARRNMAAGRTDWADLAGVAGAGAGGLGVGIADPGLIVKARHQKAVEENQQAQAQEIERRNAESIIAGRNADIDYKKTLPAKAARDQELREADIQRKTDYQNESLRIRNDALEGRISFQDWQKQQKELDRQFSQEKFQETQRHNKVTEGISQQNADTSRARSVGNPQQEATDAQTDASVFEQQIKALDEKAKTIRTFLPARDSKTGEVARDASGREIPTRSKTPERVAYEQERRALQKKWDDSIKRGRKAGYKVSPTGDRESQIRSAAKAQGLDPDIAVQKARAKGIL